MVQKRADAGQVLRITETDDFVEVIFAKSMAQAVDCRDALERQNIPARVEQYPNVSKHYGVAVLVPPDQLVAATQILAGRMDEDDDDLDDYGNDDDDLDEDEDLEQEDYEEDEDYGEEEEDIEGDEDFDQEVEEDDGR